MTTIAIICKPNKDELGPVLPELIAWLRKRSFEPLIDLGGAQYTQAAPVMDRGEMAARKPALVIVLGGDGTLLDAARRFSPSGVPIMGVNLGSLGFLTEVRLADLYSTLGSWCEGRHLLDERAMLHAEHWQDGRLKASFEALNDVVVSKGDVARMGDFEVELDGREVARFRADGVIVSTPTGSTAYTLAANGPILTPDVDALVVTPISPHQLTLRPIVVRDSALLAVRVHAAPNQALLTVDGQLGVVLEQGDEVRCCRSRLTVKLVRLKEGGFFEALRSKLRWCQR